MAVSTKGFSSSQCTTRHRSWWEHVNMATPDMIWGVYENFMKDNNKNKICVGVGAYRCDDGHPYILPSVIEAERRIFEKRMNKEYIPSSGTQDFCDKSVRLALGEDNKQIKDGLTCTAQALSGAGALRIGLAFLSEFHLNRNIYVSNPTWDCHVPMIKSCQMTPKYYRYFDSKTCRLDFKGLIEDFINMPAESVVILQACAHNPTGIDPTIEQWKQISTIMKQKRLFPFFDMAYQGFVSGDPDIDSRAIQLFLQDGHNLAIAQSFGKIMGIYGERTGALTFITGSEEESKRILSQIKLLIRSMYSNPPIHGARIVCEILGDVKLKKQWLNELREMTERIVKTRQALVNNLKKEGSKKDWSHIAEQKGMFCFSGLTKEECNRLKREFSIYLTDDGRIAMGNVNSKNVQYLAHAMHKVTTHHLTNEKVTF